MTITDGPQSGCLAIILKPIGPFPFLKLPAELRNYIYRFMVNDDCRMIHMKTSTRGGRGATAPYYRSKNRLSMLRINPYPR